MGEVGDRVVGLLPSANGDDETASSSRASAGSRPQATGRVRAPKLPPAPGRCRRSPAARASSPAASEDAGDDVAAPTAAKVTTMRSSSMARRTERQRQRSERQRRRGNRTLSEGSGGSRREEREARYALQRLAVAGPPGCRCPGGDVDPARQPPLSCACVIEEASHARCGPACRAGGRHAVDSSSDGRCFGIASR